MLFFNRGTTPREISVTWEQLHYPGCLVAKLRDLWRHKDIGTAAGRIGAVVGGHGVVMLMVSP